MMLRSVKVIQPGQRDRAVCGQLLSDNGSALHDPVAGLVPKILFSCVLRRLATLTPLRTRRTRARAHEVCGCAQRSSYPSDTPAWV
jgi:hypothetical protein